MKKIVGTRGITLMSLVITIIVLIILAGVSINSLVGDNGIITKAKQAKENVLIAKKEEEAQLNQLYGTMEGEDDKIIGDECEGTIQNLKEQIEELKRIIEQKDKQIDEIMKAYSLIFEYTGEVQEWEVPITGIYKLEVYGAQGGSYTYGGIGGKGGYCAGNYLLNAGQKIYVVVGGMPGSSSQAGGYNGGGFGGIYSSDRYRIRWRWRYPYSDF